ncbi:MAG: hypothetical protein NVS4B10_13020 [Myxococcales bacterium]
MVRSKALSGARAAALLPRVAGRLVRGAGLAACLAAAGCGPHVDVSAPVVTTLSSKGVAARPVAVCNTAPPPDPVTGRVPVGWLVTVVGAGFLPQVRNVTADRPQVDLPAVSFHGPVDRILPPTFVSYRDPAALDIAVPVTGPDAFPPGLYDATVRNPEGTSATLAGALQVVTCAP